MSSAQSVSVIIPTYNGAKSLPTVLSALVHQDTTPLEIIVLIDGSTDDSARVADQYLEKLPNLKIIQQPNTGRAGARNAGARAAIGEWLIFFDDDMEPEPDSVSRHVKTLSEFSDCISVGQIELAPDKSEYGKYQLKMNRKWTRQLGQVPRPLSEEELYLTAATMGVSSANFNQLNGFDASLTDAEDFDLALRAQKMGIKTVFDPLNVARHKSLGSFRANILRQRQYREAQKTLKAKRRNEPNYFLYKRYDVDKTGIKRFVYFFVPGWLPGKLDKGLLTFLPEKFRFAIYSRVIAALSVYYPNRQM